jgi:hypothetical protein
MTGIVTRRQAPEMSVRLTITRVERRLLIVLCLLAVAIALMLGPVVGQPAWQYLTGSDVTVAAVMEGAGCGSHLEWAMGSEPIQRGTTVRFENQTVYWQIPIVIEKQNSDGTIEVVATSPPIKDGESWSYTFWRAGDYRVVSGQEVQQLAGLDKIMKVRS